MIVMVMMMMMMLMVVMMAMMTIIVIVMMVMMRMIIVMAMTTTMMTMTSIAKTMPVTTNAIETTLKKPGISICVYLKRHRKKPLTRLGLSTCA